MATASTMVKDIVRFSGIPEPTLKGYVQQLRDANMIHKTGRGASAAAMSHSDATALLAATLANPTIAEAAQGATTVMRLPLKRSYLYNPRNTETTNPLPTPGSKHDDLSHISTLGDALRQITFRAVAFCAKSGNDPEGWEILFADSDPSKIAVAYCRPAEFGFITLELSPTEHLRLEYSKAAISDHCQHKDPFHIAYQLGGHRNVDSTIFFRRHSWPMPARS